MTSFPWRASLRLAALAAASWAVAGCTEVPLVMDAADLATPFIDATQALARRCVEVCLAAD